MENDVSMKKRIRLDMDLTKTQIGACLGLGINETYSFDTENPKAWRIHFSQTNKESMEFQTFLKNKTLTVWRIL